MPYLMQMDDNEDMTRSWELGNETMIFGRSEDADIQIEDETMSPKHFAIQSKDGGHEVRDLEGGSGTRLNDGEIKSQALAATDIIEAGSTKFYYDVGMSTMINKAEEETGRTIKSELQDIYKQFE